MTNKKSSDEIFDLLDSAGLSRSYVESLLPSWWDDQVTDNPAGLSEFKLQLSRNLGVDIEGFSKEEPSVEFRLPHVRKLKRSIRYEEESLNPAISIALSTARMAIAGCKKEFQPLPPAEVLREEIFEKYGASYVSLRSLIKVCWDHGIPVVHISRFPDRLPKMDGLVANIENRPAIVLSKIIPFSAWMAFILAHEMGHLSRGHCDDGEMIIDESLNENSLNSDDIDQEEKEADEYALTLLGGKVDVDVDFSKSKTIEDMVNQALSIHRERKVDAGHLILRYAYKSGEWKKSIAALKVLDTEKRAITDVLTALPYEINLSELSETSLTFLFKMCGIRIIREA